MLWGSTVPFALHKNGIPELFYAGGENFSLGNWIFVCLLLALVAVQQPVKCLTYPPLRKTWATLALHSADVFQPTGDSQSHSKESKEWFGQLCSNKQGNWCLCLKVFLISAVKLASCKCYPRFMLSPSPDKHLKTKKESRVGGFFFLLCSL